MPPKPADGSSPSYSTVRASTFQPRQYRMRHALKSWPCLPRFSRYCSVGDTYVSVDVAAFSIVRHCVAGSTRVHITYSLPGTPTDPYPDSPDRTSRNHVPTPGTGVLAYEQPCSLDDFRVHILPAVVTAVGDVRRRGRQQYTYPDSPIEAVAVYQAPVPVYWYWRVHNHEAG